MGKRVIFENLGRIRYKEALDYQEDLFEQLIREKLQKKEDKQHFLLFCEHEHVYTLGKSGDSRNLLITRSVCESRNIDLHSTGRGGDITYHGPGQLVAYPIIDLEDFQIGIKRYISMLEDVVIETLRPFGILGKKDAKAMGVWIHPVQSAKARKICAIGVRASRFVTMHGLALNVNSDLAYFDHINPCGFTDRGVTSMQKELGREVDFKAVSDEMKNAFTAVFGMMYSERDCPA
ncbi:lipoyl(octanoyl) transferase LipB [Proteiniphilum sp. UBA1028]|jgi:lipoyl(octanoyl) transferase|uniref:lipoyl(octanoyl) transferase LipB n=1 Tax=Proteiniphilum sp. UBA1028 TaxID=1947251 RepID=UPI0025FC2156|nr:lipoyl(octanoyl) transferase LipB [Proteiniphilum sp. UBA1028]